jgi:hypothetical protein
MTLEHQGEEKIGTARAFVTVTKPETFVAVE